MQVPYARARPAKMPDGSITELIIVSFGEDYSASSVFFFAGAFFAGAFFAADFFSSAGALAAVAVAFLARVVFFAGVVTSVVSSVVAESFAEARDALTRVPFIDGHAQQSRLQIGISLPV